MRRFDSGPRLQFRQGGSGQGRPSLDLGELGDGRFPQQQQRPADANIANRQVGFLAVEPFEGGIDQLKQVPVIEFFHGDEGAAVLSRIAPLTRRCAQAAASGIA
jgi:hypothetical protein